MIRYPGKSLFLAFAICLGLGAPASGMGMAKQVVTDSLDGIWSFYSDISSIKDPLFKRCALELHRQAIPQIEHRFGLKSFGTLLRYIHYISTLKHQWEEERPQKALPHSVPSETGHSDDKKNSAANTAPLTLTQKKHRALMTLVMLIASGETAQLLMRKIMPMVEKLAPTQRASWLAWFGWGMLYITADSTASDAIMNIGNAVGNRIGRPLGSFLYNYLAKPLGYA